MQLSQNSAYNNFAAMTMTSRAGMGGATTVCGGKSYPH